MYPGIFFPNKTCGWAAFRFCAPSPFEWRNGVTFEVDPDMAEKSFKSNSVSGCNNNRYLYTTNFTAAFEEDVTVKIYARDDENKAIDPPAIVTIPVPGEWKLMKA